MDSVALKDLYEAQGYVTVPGVLTEADIDPLKNCAKRLTDGFAQELRSEGKLTSDYEDEPFDKRIVSILAESGAPVHNWTFHSSKQNHTRLARWNVDIRFSSTPGMQPVSKEEEEAGEMLSQKMAQMGKPSMPVRGHGTGVSFEEWRGDSRHTSLAHSI